MKYGRLIVSCLVLLGTFLFLHQRSSEDAVSVAKPLKDLPGSIGEWHARESSPFDDATLKILKLNDYAMVRYADPQNRSLWLYVGYWGSQRKGAQIHSPKNCLPGGGWEPLESTTLTIPLSAPGSAMTVNSYLLQKGNNKELVLYWYQSRDTVTAGEIPARIQMVKNSILSNRSDGAIVRVSSPVYGSVAETTQLLVGYIRQLNSVLVQYLPQ